MKKSPNLQRPCKARQLSFYRAYNTEQWGKLSKANTIKALSESELRRLRGQGETVSTEEVRKVYQPLTQLLERYRHAHSTLHQSITSFLHHRRTKKTPYIIGIAGSVAVGKSTTARILQKLLMRLPDKPRVELVNTDGFLLPGATLQQQGLMERKGFPESYDIKALVNFLYEMKSGKNTATVPIYSHYIYDVTQEVRTITQPDILIIEGLNVLQPARPGIGKARYSFVSDFFDFSIFLDAQEKIIRQWYLERFMEFREKAKSDKKAYFYRFASLSHEEALKIAQNIWNSINSINLRENILPTRERADLILQKEASHAISKVLLRKL